MPDVGTDDEGWCSPPSTCRCRAAQPFSACPPLCSPTHWVVPETCHPPQNLSSSPSPWRDFFSISSLRSHADPPVLLQVQMATDIKKKQTLMTGSSTYSTLNLALPSSQPPTKQRRQKWRCSTIKECCSVAAKAPVQIPFLRCSPLVLAGVLRKVLCCNAAGLATVASENHQRLHLSSLYTQTKWLDSGASLRSVYTSY